MEKLKVNVKYKNENKPFRMLIIKEGIPPIIGCDWLTMLNTFNYLMLIHYQIRIE